MKILLLTKIGVEDNIAGTFTERLT